MTRPTNLLLLVVLAVAASTTITRAADAPSKWADLQIEVSFDGPAPQLKVEPTGPAAAFCANMSIPDERMLVSPNGKLANFALIMDMTKSKATSVHPELAQPSGKPLTIEISRCVFSPRVTFVQTGTPVTIENKDVFGHNFKVDTFNNGSTNTIIPIGGQFQTTFEHAERANFVEASCIIHPWVIGQLIIRDHPYVGVSNEKGIINIEKLPVGKVTFKLVHENMKKSISEGILDGKKQKWKSGYIELDLQAGLNEHTITLSPSLFKK